MAAAVLNNILRVAECLNDRGFVANQISIQRDFLIPRVMIKRYQATNRYMRGCVNEPPCLSNCKFHTTGHNLSELKMFTLLFTTAAKSSSFLFVIHAYL